MYNALKKPGRVQTATQEDHGIGTNWWELHLLRLLVAFRLSEGKAVPTRIVPFRLDQGLIRFLVCPVGEAAPVGMATISIRSDGTGTRLIGTVEDVFVLPEHRGNGYSTLLVGSILDTARRRKLACLELASSPHKPGHAIAMRVYEKFGFRRVASADPDDKETTNFYRLKL